VSTHALASLAALGAVVVWGGSFAATKPWLAELSPATLLFARTIVAALFVGGALAARGRLRPLPLREWPTLVALSGAGLVATQLLQAWALTRSTSANTAWLVGLSPIVTAMGGAMLLGERLTGKLGGLALAFAGAMLVVTGGASPVAVLALPSTHGDLLTLLSTVTWTAYTLLGRRFLLRHDAVLVTAHVLAIASLAYLPAVTTGRAWQELAALSGHGWLAIAYLGLGCSGVAFALYVVALERLEASQAAAFIYIEPLVAQLVSLVVLHEPLTPTVLVGGAAILAGVYLVSRADAGPESGSSIQGSD
jgi:drug/metabolite transporter (DMT)-like permease